MGIKKILSIALTISTIVLLLGPSSIAPRAQAQTIAELQAQIQALSAMIASLTANQVPSTPSTSSYSFTRDLTVGSKGDDVVALQNWLISMNKGSAAAALANVGATGFFGSLTRAAVSEFQASAGISPTAGYFGPKSRAYVASMSVYVPPVSVTPITPPITPGVTPPTTPVIPGVISVMSGMNIGGSIIAGAAQVPVLNFKIANGTSASIWVNGLKFQKTGVVSDSNITNAYLSLANNIVAQYTSLANGIVTFSGQLFEVPAGQTADVWLRMDVSTSVANGNTLAFHLASVADVMLSTGTASGSFPISGGNYTLTSVSNPSLATISTFGYQGVSGTVDAGTTGFRGGAFNVTVTNSPVRLTSFNPTITGSLSLASDLRNAILKVDGATVATAQGVGFGGRINFDLSANPLLLSTGSHIIEVYFDVLGTPFRNFTVQMLRPYDWTIVDTQYNSNINGGTPTTGSATAVTVRAGSITANLDTSTPTGSIAKGATNVTIAKFALRAAGEAVRIKSLPFKLTQTGSTWTLTPTNTVDTDIRNISIIGDDGTQVGSTINTPSTCSATPAAPTTLTYTCSFGSTSNPINYTIPANTTRVLSLKVDLQSAATLTSLKGSLTAGTSNAEGQISFQTSSTPGGEIGGSILTVSSTPFTVSQNSGFTSPIFVGGANSAKIGSFSFSASAAEGIRLSSITVTTSASVNLAGGLLVQNLRLRSGSTDWDYNVPTVSPSTAYTFSAGGSPVVIPAGGSLTVDVYADVLTGSGQATYTAPISITGGVGVGANSNTNQGLTTSAGSGIPTPTASLAGQTVIISGAGTLTASVDTSIPSSQQVVMGSTGVTLGQFRFTADNKETISIQDLRLHSTTTLITSLTPASFTNLALYDGATMVAAGTSLQASTTNTNNYYSDFHMNTPVNVAANATKILTLKGDVVSFTNSTTSQGSMHRFNLGGAGAVVAFGLSSASSTSVTAVASQSFPLNANTQTVLKTKLTASFSNTISGISNCTSSCPRTANHDIGVLKLDVTPGLYNAEFASVTLKFSGAALTVATDVALVDQDTGASTTSMTIPAGASTAVFTLPSTQLITAGASKSYRVRVNASNFTNPGTGTEGLSVQIANPTDLTWRSEGQTLATENLGLQANAVPITLSVSYE